MSTYAQVTNGKIVRVAPAPTGPGYEDGAWRDFSDPAVLAAWLAEYGWLPLTEEPRPADTATHTSDPEHVLIDGTPVLRWKVRTKTEAELAAEAAAAEVARQTANAITLTTGAKGDNPKVEQAITDLATLLGDATTVGSIRAWKQPITNNQSITGAQGKSLADLLIADAQATRRIARQVLRLAKLLTNDTSSADVGTE